MTEKKQKKRTAEQPAKATRTTQGGENIVPVGKKPVMNYVVACILFFNSGAEKVVVKARGGQSVEQLTPSNC